MKNVEELSFEDAKELVDYGLQQFYQNDKILLDYKTEYDAVAERCMVFHIGWYIQDKLIQMNKWSHIRVDCEYNRNYKHPKGMYNEVGQTIKNMIPDLIIHERRSNSRNLIVVEFKKGRTTEKDRSNDDEKLRYFTGVDGPYQYEWGFFVELMKEKARVFPYHKGIRKTNMVYINSCRKTK